MGLKTLPLMLGMDLVVTLTFEEWSFKLMGKLLSVACLALINDHEHIILLD
jgi:hypothetical protein